MKSPLTKLNALISQRDPRSPLANVSNAGYLMGDIIDDLAEEAGDADFGDINDEPDDVLAAYDVLMGDPYDLETGAITPSAKKKIAYAGAGALGGTALGILTARALKKRAARKAALASQVASSKRKNSTLNQLKARRLMGKLPHTARINFFSVMGGILNSSPISAAKTFPASLLKGAFDRQQVETPFEVDITPGVWGGSGWSITFTGVATNRFYIAVVVRMGINHLVGAPGTVFTITGTFPLMNGVLNPPTPFSFTVSKGFDMKFMIFPWQIVANEPLFALGSYSNANPVVVNITGLPNSAAVTGIIPGSQHTWTIGMRNRLM